MNNNRYKKQSIINHNIWMAILIVLSGANWTSGEETGFVEVACEKIPVLESEQLPVTGIEIDQLLVHHVQDFPSFVKNVESPQRWGISMRWRLPKQPYRTLEQLMESWENADPRRICIYIGVFRDHRSALEAAAYDMETMQEPPGPRIFQTERSRIRCLV